MPPANAPAGCLGALGAGLGHRDPPAIVELLQLRLASGRAGNQGAGPDLLVLDSDLEAADGFGLRLSGCDGQGETGSKSC